MNRKSASGKKLFSILMTGMLVLGMFPGPGQPTASALAADKVYAAAYMGAETAAGTNLPASINIGGSSTAVSWNIGEDTFALPYETVTVSGTTASGPVTASVEVIPPADYPLAYFVDSGRGGDSVGNGPTASPLYEAVKDLSGGSLINQVPDQRYVSGTTDWGFDDSVQKIKSSKDGGHTDPATDPSVWVVGVRAANDNIVYQLNALEAGTYTLSSGFYDWYGSRSRVIQPRIEYQDTSGGKHTLSLSQFNVNASKINSGEFTVPADADTSVPMTLTYAYISGEKPLLSWFAIAEGGIKSILDDAKANAASMVQVLLNGNDIQADNENGLTFKGFGVLSANSTSALLMDYKSEQPEKYAEMLQILFGGEHPLMTHVKIEMGNDRNNSTGPDPATMRTAEEEVNVKRHPGFQLAADEKAVNPDLKVSILRWSAPAWADTNDKIYTWYKNTILEAYRQYGYMTSYVNPHINEHAPDIAWTKQYAEKVKTDKEGFASAEEQALYNRIQVVISDEVGIGSFGGAMVSDESLRNAVPIAGYHYNTDDDAAGNFKKLAEQYDIEIWNSEAQATFSNSAFRPNNNVKDPIAAGTGIGGVGGPLEMSNTIIKGFVNSRRTHFIYQPAIGSFYEGGQYSFKELVSARDPWSGWIHYDAGLVILQHYSRFAELGWENEDNTAGIWRAVPKASSTGATGTNPVNGRNGTPSYITLAAPDKSDFSTVIVNDSEHTKTYKLQAVNMAYTGNPSLEVWETRAADAGKAFNSNYMQYLGDVSADGGGVYTVKVKPYSTVTVTTLDTKDKAEYNTPLPVEGERTVLDTDATGAVQNTGDKFLYADDFDYSDRTVVKIGADGKAAGTEGYIDSRGGSKGAIPRYTHDRNGAFEAYLPDGSDNYVLRQQLDRSLMGLGGTWNGGDPVTAIGDNRWTNYKASIDVSFEHDSTEGSANYAAIGARYQGGGSSHTIGGTPYVLKFWFDGGWQLLVNGGAVASGNAATGTGGVKIEGFNTAYDAWHNIAVQVAGATVTAYLDGVKLAAYTDPAPELSGRVDLASGYYHVRFDNLKVETVDGYAPYYSELLDNLEMYDLTADANPKLSYSGNWNHANGAGMFIYQRSTSTSQGAGAALSYTFEGTGLDILGPNDGSAKLEVTVDGKTAVQSAETIASKELYQTYALRGLKYGQHTVEFKVLNGTLLVDAVAVVSGEVQGSPDTAALAAAVSAAKETVKLDEYAEADWQLFTAALGSAEAALTDTAAYRLDQEGAAQLAERLVSAQNQLTTGDLRELAVLPDTATYAGKLPVLPQQVEATRADGSKLPVTVKWNTAEVSFDTPYDRVAVTGTYGNLKTVVYVEVVPQGLVYFVDPGVAAEGDTPPYTVVKELVGAGLLNEQADQLSTGDAVWGHTNTGANYGMKGLGGAVVTTDKSQTGVYGSNTRNTPLVYLFPLEAGKYTLTSFHRDWWSNANRTMDITVSYNDAEGKPVTETVRTGVVAGPNGVMLNHDFTLPVSGTVKYTINNTYSGNQAALVSYVAIARDKTIIANELAVNEAKSIIEGAAFNVKKEEANSEEAVQAWLQQTISGLEGLSETGVTLGDVTFTAFQGATEDTAGSFSFTVALSKGEALATGSASGTITLPEPDVTPPVITLNGDRVVNVKLGSDYTDAGATAADEVDGDLTDRIVTTVSSEVYGLTELDTSIADVYTFHYNVSDAAGNKALEVTRTVVVAEDPDTVKPVITLLGEPAVELENGAAYTDAGATAEDDRDGDLTGQIIATLTKGGQPVAVLDTAEAGTYLYHYNVSDAAGNAAAEVTRTVTVAEKELPPVTEPTPAPTPSPAPTPAPTDAPVQTAPPVAATPTPTPAVQNVRTLEQKDIPAAADGAVTVQLAEGTESVVLPAGIQGLTGSNTLRLAWSSAAVEFTPDALKSIVEKAAAGQAQAGQVRIRLTGLKTPAAAAEQLINSQAADSSLRLSAAGEVISFSLETVAADGIATKVTAFDVPLRLTFNVNPDANPDLLGVYYIAGDGSVQYIGGTLKNGKMTAAVSHFSQYAVLEYDKSFADVGSSMWANSVIKSLAARHIIEGISATEFAPQGQVTRAQFAAMIARALGLEAADGSTPAFRDVGADAWYADSIAAVNQAGLVLGRTADTFVPDSSITREEMAVMVVRAYEYLQGEKAQAASAGSFSDQLQISGWAQEAVSIAVEAGLLQGRGGQQFAPQALMTRAESAQVIYNLLKQ
ncbi:S-layer homology domain-containing protein [Paenibacillus sp. FSL R7-0273]|uniref:S-layer homology domain-containing protein n=1 Tax=Paenibacillus sp. FSL R7-0273 TaxID=1536772 RepID=UPI0009DDA813|nr:S-layer homology domain-containing protein [Paenibacillus sp. FSL R7-0273]